MKLLVIIGLQKAATTSLHIQLSQHVQIKSSLGLKDVDLFGKLYKGYQSVNDALKPFSKKNCYTLHTHVNYIMYEESLRRIIQQYSEVKVVVITRDPVDRAISAYKYFRRKGIENRSMSDALHYVPKKLNEITECNDDNDNFTYIEHGFNSKLVSRAARIFGHENLYVLSYEDYTLNQQDELQLLTKWLGISAYVFKPVLSNQSGPPKFRFIKKMMDRRSRLKRIFRRTFIFVFGNEKYQTLKHKIFLWNISSQKEMNMDSSKEEIEVRKYLTQRYENC